MANQVGPTAMNAGLVYEVMKEKPDLVFICKGDQLGFNTVVKIKEYAKTFYWFPDPIMTAAPHLIKLASVCTYASCTGLGVAKFFVANGVERVFHIFEGVDSEYYYPVEEDSSFKANVSFIGSRTPERMDYLYNLGAKKKDSKYILSIIGYFKGEAKRANECIFKLKVSPGTISSHNTGTK